MEEKKLEKKAHIVLAITILCLVGAIICGCFVLFGHNSNNDTKSIKMPSVPVITDDPDAIIYSKTTDGDILFNDLQWGTDQDAVFQVLSNLFSNATIDVEQRFVDFGTGKQVVCEYTNKEKRYLGKIGEIDISKVKVYFLLDNGKNNCQMYYAEYESYDYSKYNKMAEMINYKYGEPYSYKKESTEYSYFESTTWKNKDKTHELILSRAIDFEKRLTIEYIDSMTSSYVTNQKELYESQKKEEELANKNYEGI